MILDWQNGQRHLDRLLSFRRRKMIDLALLRISFSGSTLPIDLAAITSFIQATTRKHEILMLDPAKGDVYLLLLGAVDRQALGKAANRCEELLRGKGYVPMIQSVRCPDDGETAEELLAALGDVAPTS